MGILKSTYWGYSYSNIVFLIIVNRSVIKQNGDKSIVVTDKKNK